MSRPIDILLDKYGESHQHPTNKLVHWICVPAIMFSLLALVFCIPFPGARNMVFNWAFVLVLIAGMYYIRLSFPLFIGFVIIVGAMLWGILSLYISLGQSTGKLAIVSLIIFAVAWVGQFIGHHIEGKKPSFLQDIQFLLIGPAWLMHFIFKKMGIQY